MQKYEHLNSKLSHLLRKSEDLADPQTKLSPHMIGDVQRSWENIRGDRNAMVSDIFIKWVIDSVTHHKNHEYKINTVVQRLFKETPRIQKFFAKFASVAADALPGNADYEKQIALVADRVDTIISALDDKLQLLGNINYMRYTHAARSIPRGVWDVI